MGSAVAIPPVVEEIIRFNQDGKPKLVRLKYRRMDETPFAFFRGTDHLFGRAWPELKPPEVGPAILISGDLHLENFGAYEADDGEFLFDINDFDEALVAPCSLDLVRCTTSILLAGELWSLTPIQSAAIALVFLNEYRAAVLEAIRTRTVGEVTRANGEGPIWDLLGATALGSQTELLNRLTRSKGKTRKIRRDPAKRPEISAKRAEKVRASVEHYGAQRKMAKTFRVLDVTGRIAGIGSLGVRRYIALIESAGSPEGNRLLDIKEARPSSLLSCTDHLQPDTDGNEAQRVVNAQKLVQAKPTRGLDVLEIDNRSYRMRELVPDENRSRLDLLQHEPDKLRAAVAVAGRLTGWSQVRGCHWGPEDRTPFLARWATGPALDSVLAAAVRYADRTMEDYQEFHRVHAAGRLDRKVERKQK